MSNYYHDTKYNKCDGTCSNCRFAVERGENYIACTEQSPGHIFKLSASAWLMWLLEVIEKFTKAKIEIVELKLKTKYCSEHEFREDC